CETIVIPEPLALTVRLPDGVGGTAVVLVPVSACIPAPPEGPAPEAARPRVGAASAMMLALKAETT
ncbi:MAG: hypothetical protein ACXVW5_27155, partial [Solirubrobacteraceae bacterium]